MNYTDQEFANEVVKVMKKTGEKYFTTSQLKDLFNENEHVLQLYKGVSWAQNSTEDIYIKKQIRFGSSYTGPAWRLTSFPDRIVRNMKKVCKLSNDIEHVRIPDGSYTISYPVKTKIPKYRNTFVLK